MRGSNARLKGPHVVGEDDDFVATLLVVLDEVLAGVELVRVHHVQEALAPGTGSEMLRRGVEETEKEREKGQRHQDTYDSLSVARYSR
jgi:hypothetical protein